MNNISGNCILDTQFTTLSGKIEKIKKKKINKNNMEGARVKQTVGVAHCVAVAVTKCE